MFDVSPGVLADAEGIAACLQILGYGTSQADVAKKLDTFIGSPFDAFFVARGTTIVGVISVHLIPLIHTEGFLARLTSLVVQPGHQKSGLGTRLVEAAEAWAWASGAVRIEVTSGDHRPEAHKFYRARGYKEDERRFIKRV